MAVVTSIDLFWTLRKKSFTIFALTVIILHCGDSLKVIQHTNENTSSGEQIKMVGRISIASSPCLSRSVNGKPTFYKYGTGCRQKRETDENYMPQGKPSINHGIHLHLETPKHLFRSQNFNPKKDSVFRNIRNDTTQHNENEHHNQTNVESSTSQIMLHLSHSPQIVAPNFKLIVRDASNNIISTNQTIAFPSCLYTGIVDGVPTAKVSLSTCGGLKKLV